MRKLESTNSDLDIYQPVGEEDLKYVEEEFQMIFPAILRNIYKNPSIELMNQLPFFLWFVEHQTIGILERNNELHHRCYDPYPINLIAFATYECGDFWVINKFDNSITYIDPDKSIQENSIDKGLYFESFENWLKYQFTKMR